MAWAARARGAVEIKARRPSHELALRRASTQRRDRPQDPGALRVRAADGHLLRCGFCAVGRPRSSPTPCIWPSGVPNAVAPISRSEH